MCKVIAISGVSNTGKTSLLEGGSNNNSIIDKISSEGLAVKYYNEIARSMFHLLPDMTKFQEAIWDAEVSRVGEVRDDIIAGIYDAIIIDRTWYDNVLYNKFNVDKGMSTAHTGELEDIYDSVILLNTPFRDNKRHLTHYNSDEFRDMFNKGITERYSPIVFKNASEYSKILEYVLSQIR